MTSSLLKFVFKAVQGDYRYACLSGKIWASNGVKNHDAKLNQIGRFASQTT